MALYTQQGRLISLTTPLGDDKLLLTRLTGHEAISRMFQFHLTALSEDASIQGSQIIGQSVTINITQSDDSQRYFNGIVSHFACPGKEGDMTRYELQVVPKLWLLTRYADCRIFHNMQGPDIIKSVLDHRGISYQASLQGSYRKLEYCVQYRETDFNFISRLMEQYGIFYFFKHEDGAHTMMLGDSNSVHTELPDMASASFNLAGGGLDAGDVVNSWSFGNELRSGKVSLTDYNFTTSATDLFAEETTIHSMADNSSMELFDYPGLNLTASEGKATTKIRMQEEECVYAFGRGSGVCRAFTSGYKVDLQQHPIEAMNKSYLLTEVRHSASVTRSYRNEVGQPDDFYSNEFSCIPSDLPFRPARVTPKPLIQGPQSAIVVGKSSDQDSADDEGAGGDGEEIWVDKWGRVLVHLPWDRQKKISCWVRVSQDWAGKGWGMINIPRVGQEVLVSFLDGDPDRPIITGRVYNDVQTVPYTLPDNGTRTTFRTSSSTGGGTAHYNELRFEDKAGSEQVFLRGEKDFDTRILNDSREWIGNNQSIMIQKNRMENVGGDESTQITGKRAEKVGGDDNLDITGNLNQRAGQNISIQAGQNLYEKSGQNFAHEAGMAIHLKAGMTFVLEAGVQLSLKAGGSFIDIGPEGIAISGAPMVMINSGGSAGSGSGSSPTSPVAPQKPDEADDGSKGSKMNS